MKRSLLFLLVAITACSSGHRTKELDAGDAARLLVDRNWIDVMPKDPQDRLHVFRFVPSMGGGVYQDRTLYRGDFELFRFRADRGELSFDFPDRSERYRATYKIESVDGPEPFDLKLTIDRSPRGPSVYYGMRRERGDLDAMLGAAVTPRR
jgi:hypothetical protein